MTKTKIKTNWFDRFFSSATGFLPDDPYAAIRRIVLEEYYALSLRMNEPRWPAFLRLTGVRLLQAKQLTFFTALFSLLAKLAESDGPVTKRELSALEDFMEQELKLTPKQKVLALQIFRKARASATTFEKYAKDYYQLFRKNRSMRENLIDALLAIALADKRIHIAEARLIKVALTTFKIQESDYARIKARHEKRYSLQSELEKLRALRHKHERQQSERLNQGARRRSRTHITTPLESESAFNQACKLLGVSPQASTESVKKAYRKLVLSHHPDRLAAQGLPDEFRSFATKHFREIQEAFELIKLHRRI